MRPSADAFLGAGVVGRNEGAAMAAIANSTAATAPAPPPSFQPKAMMPPPIDAPASAPRLKKPWNEDMVGRPRARSISEACVFTATLAAPAVTPRMKVATKKTGVLQATIGAMKVARNTRSSTVAAGREPVRPTSPPVSGWLMTPPSPTFKRARPRIAGSSASLAAMTGIWTAQIAKPRPNTKKPQETAIRARMMRWAFPLVSANAAPGSPRIRAEGFYPWRRWFTIATPSGADARSASTGSFVRRLDLDI